LLLTIEKRGMNTAFAARAHRAVGAGSGNGVQLCRASRTAQRGHPPALQRAPAEEDRADYRRARIHELRVLGHTWHSRKLPRGALAGKSLRDASCARSRRSRSSSSACMRSPRGRAQLFGEQRFGAAGDNVAQALRNVRRPPRPPRGAHAAAVGGALGSVQPRARPRASRRGTWNTALEGEVWALDGSRSVFGPEPFAEELAARLAAFDIHPSGRYGARVNCAAQAEVAELETRCPDGDEALALRRGLEAAGLEQERRSLRLRPWRRWQWARTTPRSNFRSHYRPDLRHVVLAELGAVGSVSSGLTTARRKALTNTGSSIGPAYKQELHRAWCRCRLYGNGRSAHSGVPS
jgi:tRNA pseudouridine13 synthase